MKHKVRALIRVVVCDCGWQARSDRVKSLDGAFHEHQAQQLAVELREHLRPLGAGPIASGEASHEPS